LQREDEDIVVKTDNAVTRAKRPVYLHVGSRKSGTSYLQAAILASQSALREQGVGLPLPGRGKQVQQILTPLRLFDDEQPSPQSRQAMTRLAERLAEDEGSRLLLTLEDLAELDAPKAALLIDALSDFEVHLVITARDWSRQIPSEWQQCVKERVLATYPEFARRIRDGAPDAQLFLARQDVAGIASRWGASLPPERVHIVAVPRTKTDPGRLVRLFAGVVGFDPESLEPAGSVNRSLGYEQAETLRRINVALGDRLADVPGEYRFGVRLFIHRHALIRQDGTPFGLPPELVGWCHEHSVAQAKELAERGYDIVGSLDDLIVPNEPAATDLEEVSDSQVAEVAVRALADLAVLRFRETKKRSEPPAAAGPRTTDEEGKPPAPRPRSRGALARLLGRSDSAADRD
jgi:hypothetical protein